MISALRDLASQALSAAKSALGIGSPSKLFADEIGRWIPEGVSVGITGNLEPINDALSEMINMSNTGINRALSSGMASNHAQKDIDYDRLAEAISSRPVVIQGDTSRIFKVVRQQNKMMTKSTNWNALGAATT